MAGGGGLSHRLKDAITKSEVLCFLLYFYVYTLKSHVTISYNILPSCSECPLASFGFTRFFVRRAKCTNPPTKIANPSAVQPTITVMSFTK